MTSDAGVAIAEAAELEQLGDIPVDDVLGIIDRPTPGYRDLYYRWERQQWEAGTIDFSEDRRQWVDDLTPELRRAVLWNVTPLYVGQHQVTDALVPFVDAAPTEEQQVFLTTQLVDVARHMVFFDRFYSEALDEEGDMQSRLDAHRDRLTPGFRTVLLEMLPEASAKIRRDPGDRGALVEGVVLYHLVIQASLVLTTQRFLLGYLLDNDLLPGFRQGSIAAARDAARHVAFGIRFLRDMVEQDGHCADIIRSALTRIMPVAMSALEPPESYLDPLPYGPGDLSAFALESLTERSGDVGVERPGL